MGLASVHLLNSLEGFLPHDNVCGVGTLVRFGVRSRLPAKLVLVVEAEHRPGSCTVVLVNRTSAGAVGGSQKGGILPSLEGS